MSFMIETPVHGAFPAGSATPAAAVTAAPIVVEVAFMKLPAAFMTVPYEMNPAFAISYDISSGPREY